jgi:hypothetical protein
VSGALRCGLLLDSVEIPWWLAEGLDRAIRNETIEIVAALISTPPPSPPGTRLGRHWKNRHSALSRLLLRMDERRRSAPPPWPDRSLADLAPKCLTIAVTPIQGRFTDEIPADDLARLTATGVELLIREGFRILKGDILTAAPRGILSFHHGDNRVNRGGPTGVWEVLLGEDTSGLTMQIMGAELDGGLVLARSIGRTERYSFSANRRAIFARSPIVLSRTLDRIHRGETGVHGSARDDPSWTAYDGGILRFPDNSATLAGTIRMARQRLSHWRKWARKSHQWSIAWIHDAGDNGGTPNSSLRRYRLWPSPPGIFRADPFPVVDGDRHWLYFEEYDYRLRRGVLKVVEWGRNGAIGEPLMALEEPYHLSYPNVFHRDGDWYLLPEGAAGGHVELYRAAEFPHRWERHLRLLDGIPLIDPTLVEHQGHWYLFGNLTNDGIGPDDELHAFVATDWRGPFQPHPANPIVTDVRSARMAGRFFRHGEDLFRPSQIGAPRYGSGLAIHRVAELTPTTYREESLQQLFPRWDPDAIGLHTINAAGRLSVIDLRRLVPAGIGQP